MVQKFVQTRVLITVKVSHRIGLKRSEENMGLVRESVAEKPGTSMSPVSIPTTETLLLHYTTNFGQGLAFDPRI